MIDRRIEVVISLGRKCVIYVNMPYVSEDLTWNAEELGDEMREHLEQEERKI